MQGQVIGVHAMEGRFAVQPRGPAAIIGIPPLQGRTGVRLAVLVFKSDLALRQRGAR